MRRGKDAAVGSVAQLVSSGGSFLLSLAAARTLSIDSFGVFAMVFAAITIVIGAVRALTAELYLFRYSGTGEDVGPVFGGGLVVGAVLAVIAVLGGLSIGIAGDSTNAVLWWLAAGVMLGALLQDQARFLLIGVRRAQYAVAGEILAVAIIVIGFFLTWSAGIEAMWAVLLIWLLSAIPAVAMGMVQLGIAGPRSSIHWLKRHASEGRTYLADFLLTNGVTNGVIFIVAAVGGAAASAALRGAQVLLTPILLVTRGGAVGFAPEFKRLAARGDRRALIGLSAWFTVATTLMVVATVVIVTAVPAGWLEIALGESAAASAAVLPACALAVGLAGTAMAPALALRASGDVKAAFRSKLFSSPVAVAGATLGSIIGGAAGSQVGLAIGEAFRAGLNWFILLRNKKGFVG